MVGGDDAVSSVELVKLLAFFAFVDCKCDWKPRGTFRSYYVVGSVVISYIFCVCVSFILVLLYSAEVRTSPDLFCPLFVCLFTYAL